MYIIPKIILVGINHHAHSKRIRLKDCSNLWAFFRNFALEN